ncbi:MAG: AmmeMemoRadiSam system protein B [Candidatus Bathyarchaeia archaeon]
MRIRYPAHAGSFYPSAPDSLRREIRRCFLHELGPGRIPEAKGGPGRVVGLICPHAGYMYSGHIAAHAYCRLGEDRIPESVVILGPDHTGSCGMASMMIEGAWRTPIGDLAIDSDLARAIRDNSDIIDVNDFALKYEHSIEVQLPFLIFLFGSGLKFVPICMGFQDLSTSREIAESIASAREGREIVVIASSDMSHYEPRRIAEENDRAAIDLILRMDEEAFQGIVESRGLSICGYGPITALIHYSKLIGSRNAKLLAYGTSGDVTGDYGSVVGYVAISFES